MKSVVAAFNQEKALVGAFSVITNLRMELFEALPGAGHWLDKMKTGGASLSLVLIHFHLNFILGITQHKIIYIFLVLKIYLCIQTIWVEEWIWIFSEVVAIKNAKIVYFWNV